MKFRFFWIPAWGGDEAEAELNAFLGRHRTVHVERHFSTDHGGTCRGWAVCVQFTAGEPEAGAPAAGFKEKVDYRDVLDPATFQIFSVLRTWRKELALEQRVPNYAVATNAQLAEIARRRIRTRAELSALEGFGESRVSRFGDSLLAVCERVIGSAPASTGGGS